MKKILIQAWPIDKINGEYFLPYTHHVYLSEIVKYFEEVCLLSSTNTREENQVSDQMSLKEFTNVVVYDLPYSKNYVSAVPFFRSYIQAYRKLKTYDIAYVRYPVAFGWLHKFFFRRKKRLVHFVGDPIEVTLKNPNHSIVKKALLILFFIPEHLAYMWACRNALVFTNGTRIQKKLRIFGIHANAIISTTLKPNDFFLDKEKKIDPTKPRILYVGYLRKWKGVETVVKAFSLLADRFSGATLTIVGSGEFEAETRKMVIDEKLQNKVAFLGHIEDREYLNRVFRSHDIFCLASISEGSPRVILEAMANGINVVSTPVGSLPDIFSDAKELRYAEYNNEVDFYEKMDYLLLHPEAALGIRIRAFEKVKNYTIESFIKTIFTS